MSIKSIVVSFIFASLLGCAAAGVPYTNDPAKKLSYAYELMNFQSRALPAEKLGLEALAQYQKANDWFGIGEAEFFLGNFYKSIAYRNYQDFYSKFNEYDQTSNKSISHFEKSIVAFEKDGDYWGVSKAKFEIGSAYAADKDLENSCSSYNESLVIYKSEKNVFKGRVHPHNPKFESYEAMVQAFAKNACQKVENKAKLVGDFEKSLDYYNSGGCSNLNFNNATQIYGIAESLFKNKEYKKSLECFLKISEVESLPKERFEYISLMYEAGIQVEQNKEKADYWSKRFEQK